MAPALRRDELAHRERTLDVAALAVRLVGVAADDRELLQGLCDLLVERAGYRLAWVGLARREPEPILEPIAWTGDEAYVRAAHVRWDDSPRGQGPSGRAVREGRAIAFNAVVSDEAFAPWREAARERGYAASCAIPLSIDAEVVGTVNVYSAREDAFDPSEVGLLESLVAAAARSLELFRARAGMAAALEEARARRDELRAIYEASPDMIFVHGGDGRLIDVNELVVEKYGIPRQALLFGPPEQLMGDEHDFHEALAHVKRALEVGSAEFEWTARRGDGSTMPVEVRLRRIPGCSGAPREPAVVAVVRDLTERKRMDAQLLEIAKLESLSSFAGGVAHDFNNSLTAMLGALTLVDHDLGDAHPLKSLVKDAVEAAMQARGLTRQLLAFAQGGASVRTVFAPGPLIEQTVRLLLAGRAIAVRTTLAPGLFSVEGDRDQIAQVLHNVVLNAVQAMKERGVLAIRAANVLSSEPVGPLPAGRYVRLEIEDDGPGIDPEDLSRIFDPFFTTKPHGTGLGLPTAFAAVRRHGGALEVQSRLGEGTTVVITLPAADEMAALPEEASPGSAARPMRVLLLEDEPTVARMLVGLLGRLGLEVVHASEGDAALQLARREREAGRRIDLALLDLTIRGGRGGREILDELRAIAPSALLVGMSGYANQSPEANVFDAFLPKPFGLAQLEALVRELSAREQ